MNYFETITCSTHDTDSLRVTKYTYGGKITARVVVVESGVGSSDMHLDKEGVETLIKQLQECLGK